MCSSCFSFSALDNTAAVSIVCVRLYWLGFRIMQLSVAQPTSLYAYDYFQQYLYGGTAVIQ